MNNIVPNGTAERKEIATVINTITVAERDAELIANGYEPVAVEGKRPVGTGWSARPNTIEAIAGERASGVSNTGLRTGRLVGIDVDLRDREHAIAVRRLADQILGATDVERVGSKGFILCYRNETPIPKVTVRSERGLLVEILGTGQQFVAYGEHPDTGQPYTWSNAVLDGEPLATSLAELPEVTPEGLRKFADAARDLLAGLGYAGVAVSGNGRVERKEAPPGLQLDQPCDIQCAVDYLTQRAPLAIEGNGGDATTFTVAAFVREYGISEDCCLELMTEHWNERCSPPWSDDDLAIKIGNAYAYADNALGCNSTEAKYGKPDDLLTDEMRADRAKRFEEQAKANVNTEEPGVTAEEDIDLTGKDAHAAKVAQRRAKFVAFDPVEAMRMPPPRYWDPEQLLIRTRLGSVSMIYAAFSNYKTTWSVGHALHTAKAKGCRILYVIGEGADGFGPKTLQAAVVDWNREHPDDPMSDDWLRAHLRLVGRAPALLDDIDLDALVAEHNDWHPQLVFLDTLGSALPGQDINTPAVGTSVGDKARYLASGFGADVYLVHHQGKDASRGATGSQYLVNDPAMVLALEHDDDARRLTVKVDKDRWGKRGREIVFGTREVSGLTVYAQNGRLLGDDGKHVTVYPLPSEDQEQAKQAAKAKKGKRKDNDQSQHITVALKLQEANAHGSGNGLDDQMLAERLIGDLPHGATEEERAHWLADIKDERNRLRAAHAQKRAWAIRLGGRVVPSGGSGRTWRWFLPDAEASG